LGLAAEDQDRLDNALSGSPIDPQGNILSLMISVAGSGKVAVSAALAGNVINNTVSTTVDDSTVLAGINAVTGDVINAAADVTMAALSKVGIIAVTVGVAGSGNVAVQATGFGNVITNTVASSVQGNATVSSGHDFSLTAYDQSTIRSLAIGVAASGSAAVSALIGANVVTNSVTAQIAGSEVSSGGAMTVDAQNSSAIYSFAGGVAASGSVAVQVSLAANVVANRTEASINDRTFDEDGNVVEGVTVASVVDAGGFLSLTADDTSSIDAIGIGVSGSGTVAVGVALSANVIANSVVAAVEGSTVDAGGSVGLAAESEAIIRAIAIGVSGSGTVAVQVTAMGNVITNTVSATITDAIVTAADDVTLAASDIAPSVIPEWMVSAEDMDDINKSLEDSPIDLDASILAINISVAGSGAVAVNGAFTGNVITNTIVSSIEDATVTATTGKVVLASDSKARIIAATVGVGASGAVAVNVTGFGNVIVNRVEASITDGAVVTTGTDVLMSAVDDSSISSIGLSVAGSGAVAVSVIVGANVITNDVAAEINDATVDSGGAIGLIASQEAAIFSFAGGVAATGAVSVQVSLAANVITNTTEASIVESTIDADGDVSLTASDISSIDSFAFGVSGSGAVAVGVALSANVIANTVSASIENSTVSAGGAVSLTAESEAIIRAVSLGVSGSGAVAVQVTAMGNVIANHVLATITGSTVTAVNDIILEASDIAPSAIPAWMVPADKMDDINESLEDSPIDLDANIVALNISVAGSGAVAVNGALTGNVIANTVRADIDDASIVRAGIDLDDVVVNAAAAVGLLASSRSRIIAITVGVGASGAVAVNATGFGNVITNTVETSVRGGSVVKSGADVILMAEDDASISSIGLSVAGSGAVAVSVIAGANVITNTVVSQVAGSTIDSGGAVDISATEDADIYGFAGGVAAAAVGVQLSLAANVITNTTEASINDRVFNEDGSIDESAAAPSSVTADDDVWLSALDTSTIDAVAFGLAFGGVAVGGVLSANVITNDIATAVENSTVDAGGLMSLSAESSAVIRSLNLGVSGAAGVAVTVNAMGNTITNSVTADIIDSTVTADDYVIMTARDGVPGSTPALNVPTDREGEVTAAFDDTESPFGFDSFTDANILAMNISISGSGLVAVDVNLTGNVIANTVLTTIDNSTVTAEGGNLTMSAESSAAITSISLGVGASGGVAVGAVAFGNVITNTVESIIQNGSDVEAGGALAVGAADRSSIGSIG
ncbi:MAG TPA: hypothetical protein ENN35_04900, partial [Deltaproteobacteria bacterium]|nr:hypothetical protein [Deltaproteobacteria bacterium]